MISHYLCRIKGPNYILGLGQECEWSENKRMVMNGSDSGFNEKDTNGKVV